MFLKLSTLPPWVQLLSCNSLVAFDGGGGGGKQASCLVVEQAVEFPQVLG